MQKRALQHRLMGPVATWGGLQLLALAVGALRIPLSANYVRPPEDWAAGVMVATQMVGLSGLFPLLMRDRWVGGVTIALLWPFLLAAGFLASHETTALLCAGVMVSLWAICLGLWGWAGDAWGGKTSAEGFTIDTARIHALLVAGALFSTLGGGVMGYLAAEYQPALLTGGGGDWWTHTPIWSTVKQLDARSPNWEALGALAALALGAWLVGRGRKWWIGPSIQATHE